MRTGTSGVSSVAGGAGSSRVSWVGAGDLRSAVRGDEGEVAPSDAVWVPEADGAPDTACYLIGTIHHLHLKHARRIKAADDGFVQRMRTDNMRAES
jgi:hypothetical protein